MHIGSHPPAEEDDYDDSDNGCQNDGNEEKRHHKACYETIIVCHRNCGGQRREGSVRSVLALLNLLKFAVTSKNLKIK